MDKHYGAEQIIGILKKAEARADQGAATTAWVLRGELLPLP